MTASSRYGQERSRLTLASLLRATFTVLALGIAVDCKSQGSDTGIAVSVEVSASLLLDRVELSAATAGRDTKTATFAAAGTIHWIVTAPDALDGQSVALTARGLVQGREVASDAASVVLRRGNLEPVTLRLGASCDGGCPEVGGAGGAAGNGSGGGGGGATGGAAGSAGRGGAAQAGAGGSLAGQPGGHAGRMGTGGAGGAAGGTGGFGGASGGAGPLGGIAGSASGGSAGSSAGGSAPLSVVSTSPAARAHDIDPSSQVTLTFSQPLDAASVTATAVSLSDGQSAVPATLSITGAKVTLTPASRLTLLGAYTINVATSVKSASGAALGAPFSASFSVREGAWGSGAQLPNEPATGYRLGSAGQFGIDGRGRALVLAERFHAETYDYLQLYGVWFDPAKGPEAPVLLAPGKTNTSGTSGVDTQQVAVNAAGDALVVWSYSGLAGAEVWGRRFHAGQWENAQLLAPTYGSYPYLAAALAPDGSGLVAWTDFTDASANSRLTRSAFVGTDGSWKTTGLGVLDPAAEHVTALALAPNGSGLGAWQTYDVGIGSNSFSGSAQSWGSTAVIPGAGRVTAEESPIDSPPVLAVDEQGSFLLTWVHSTGTGGNNNLVSKVRYTRWLAGSGWTTPADVAPATNVITTAPTLAFGGGIFGVSWTQVGPFGSDAWCALWKGTAWGSPALLSDQSGSVNGPSIGLDRLGNGLSAWTRSRPSDGQTAVFASRYLADLGMWSPAQALPAPATTNAVFLMTARDGVTAALTGYTNRGSTTLLRVSFFQ